MPNYITNVVTFRQNKEYIQEQLSFEEQIFLFKNEINTKLLHLILNEKHQFDFNILIPSNTEDWYNFNISNWGCKWNANSGTIVPEDTTFQEHIENNLCNQFTFDTAWNTPFPYFKTLSEKFPQFDIHVLFADEDIGYNCGFYVLNNGEIVEITTNETNPEQNWKKFAIHLRYGKDTNPADFGLNENYEYIDDDDEDDD